VEDGELADHAAADRVRGAVNRRCSWAINVIYEDPTGDGGPAQPSPTIGHRLIVSW
jgi:hypothetical protein